MKPGKSLLCLYLPEREFPVLLIPPPENNPSARQLNPLLGTRKNLGVAPQNPVFISPKKKEVCAPKNGKKRREEKKNFLANARKTMGRAQKIIHFPPLPAPAGNETGKVPALLPPVLLPSAPREKKKTPARVRGHLRDGSFVCGLASLVKDRGVAIFFREVRPAGCWKQAL